MSESERVFLLPVTHTEVSQNSSTLRTLLCDPFTHTQTQTSSNCIWLCHSLNPLFRYASIIHTQRQWNISKQWNCHVNLIICFFAVEINGSPKGCQTDMFVLFLPLSVPLFNLFLWARKAHKEMKPSAYVTLSYSRLKCFSFIPKEFSPGTLSHYLLHVWTSRFCNHFWLKSSTTKPVSILQLVVLGTVVNSLWRAVSGRRESEKERTKDKKGGGSALVGEALWRFISVQRTRPVGPWITDVMWGGELQGVDVVNSFLASSWECLGVPNAVFM